MKEIEILVEVQETFDEVIAKLANYSTGKTKRITDTYYYDPLRDNLKITESSKIVECFRVREMDECSYITYKKDHYISDKWEYSDEYETCINDPIILKTIIKQLGLSPLVIVDNTRHFFETDLYEFVIEDVVGLGIFLEVEYKHCTEDDSQVSIIKNDIREFITNLNVIVGEELNSGKPELLIKKNISELKDAKIDRS